MSNLELYKDVKIRSEGIHGVLLDVFTDDDGTEYAAVESSVEYSRKGSNERWPIYYCPIGDIEPLTP